MTRLQAAMRDIAAGKLQEKKHYHRMNFKKCGNCGSGDMFKSYDPSWMGWETWCWCCGIKTGVQPIRFGQVYPPLKTDTTPRLVKKA